MTEAEIMRFLIGGSSQQVAQDRYGVINSRLKVFQMAAEDRKELETYAISLQNLCVQNRDGWLTDAAIGGLFAQMEKHGIDFSETAIALLERDQFTELSFKYLRDNVRDGATIQKLSELRVKRELEHKREVTLEMIKKRLGAGSSPIR
jgi:hypothetical protein